MGAMTSQKTSLTIVYSIVCSGADQRKYQSSASLAFVRGIHRWPVNSPHKGPVTRKMFPFDDVIMGWCALFCWSYLYDPLAHILWCCFTGPSADKTTLGLYSLSEQTSYHKISWNLEATRFGFRPFSIALKFDRHLGSSTAACQISERYDHYNIQSRGFETSRGLVVRSVTA